MSKFNTNDKRQRPTGPITTTAQGTTYEGGPGFVRDARGELFMLAVVNFVGEDTFYEKATDRDKRFAALCRQVAVQDPEWFTKFLAWLRSDANMRSASLVGAAEGVQAMVAAKIPGGRKIIDSVLQRADEPGELVAYLGRNKLSKPIKRGLADAVVRLYTEYNLLKYDTESKSVRFGDVIELVHPYTERGFQDSLFKYAIDRRHGRENVDLTFLPTVRANREMRAHWARNEFRLDRLAQEIREAGMTWEDVLSGLGSKLPKKDLWEAMIPSMGYMALLRNLRNFDEAGVSRQAGDEVAKRLADPDQVAKSRQFPYRFLAAYEQVQSLRWGVALEDALTATLGNIPALPGRTLVLVDTSGSMTSQGFSAKSKMTPAKAAAIFGVALALKGDTDLYGFADGQFKFMPGPSLLRSIDDFLGCTGKVGHGTDVYSALKKTFKGHSRVVIISDMQTIGPNGILTYGGVGNRRGVGDLVPASVAVHSVNLGGYKNTGLDLGPNRFEYGSLSDASFKLMAALEQAHRGVWPWEL